MSSIKRFAKVGYVLGFFLILSLLLLPSFSQAQNGFGVSTGWRSTPGLPTIAIPIFNTSGSSSGQGVGGGGVGGFGGVGGGGFSNSFSSTPQIITIHLGSFFPNNGQIIGLPPPPMNFPLNNFLSDSTGAPTALLTGGAAPGLGGLGAGGGGIGGGGLGGMGGAGGIGGGGMGGFAGKGFGGFNGKKPL